MGMYIGGRGERREGSPSVIRKLEGQMSGRVGGRRVGGRPRGVFGNADGDNGDNGLIADFRKNGKSPKKGQGSGPLVPLNPGSAGRLGVGRGGYSATPTATV